jgi:hypothetical protein
MHTIRNDSMKYDRHDEQKGGRGKAGLSMREGEVHGADTRDEVSWIWVMKSKDLLGDPLGVADICRGGLSWGLGVKILRANVRREISAFRRAV